MNKFRCMAFILLLAPVAALAQEKTLYEISSDMLTLCDNVFYCASGENICTEAEALQLKAEAENGLKDLVKVVKSGNLARHSPAIGQVRVLAAKAGAQMDGLVHAALLYQVCNFAVLLYVYGYFLLQATLILIVLGLGGQFTPGVGLLVLLLAPVLLVAAVFLFALAALVGVSCLFWWL